MFGKHGGIAFFSAKLLRKKKTITNNYLRLRKNKCEYKE